MLSVSHIFFIIGDITWPVQSQNCKMNAKITAIDFLNYKISTIIMVNSVSKLQN